MQEFIAEKREKIAELCRKHHVRRLAVFGSAARADFDPERSDVDVLVNFAPIAPTDVLDNFIALRSDLETLFHRKIDLIREGVIRNRYRIRSIEEYLEARR